MQYQTSVLGSYERLSREDECRRILETFGQQGFAGISAEFDRQLRMLHNRAHILLAICGVLVSATVVVTTGRIVGQPGFLQEHIAGYLLVLAGIADIAASAVVVGGVLNVRWITQQPGRDLEAWVMRTLAYRDSKTRAYRVAILLVLLSMLFYQTAAAMVLMKL